MRDSYYISDHAPVTGVFKLRVDISNADTLHKQVVERALRQVDIEERQSHPTCSISPPAVHLGTLRPSALRRDGEKDDSEAEVLSSFTLTNTGHVRASFSFIKATEDGTAIPAWLRVHPMEGTLSVRRKHHVEADSTTTSGGSSASESTNLDLSLSLGGRSAGFKALYTSAAAGHVGTTGDGLAYNIDELLLLQIRNGADYIIRVNAMYEASCMGLSLSFLSTLDDPVRTSITRAATTRQGGAIATDDDDGSTRPSVPKEVRWLLHAATASARRAESATCMRKMRAEPSVSFEDDDNSSSDTNGDEDSGSFGAAARIMCLLSGASFSGAERVLERVDTGTLAEGAGITDDDADFVDYFGALIVLLSMLPEPLLPPSAASMCEFHVPDIDGVALLVQESVTPVVWQTIGAIAMATRTWLSEPGADAVSSGDDALGLSSLSPASLLLVSLSRACFPRGNASASAADLGESARRCQFLKLLFMSRCSDDATNVSGANDAGSDASLRAQDSGERMVHVGAAVEEDTCSGRGYMSPVRVVLTPRSSESGDPFVDVIVKACTE